MRRLTAPAFIWLGCLIMAVSAAELPKPLTDEDFRSYPEAQVKLGQLLFYDRILSGTYRVSCATCHNHDRASSNGARLDGKEDERDELAVNGEPVYEPFRPSAKHAPPLFNLGAKQFIRMFHDGRVEELTDGSFRSPAGKDLPKGLNDVLAVQALFPATQRDELVGTVLDDEFDAIAHKGSPAIWEALAARIRRIDEYWPYFEKAFPALESRQEISITHIANAIGVFVGTEWRSDDAPFDRYLRGNEDALTSQQKRGMSIFYGKAKCDVCHSGALQTDHGFYRVHLEWPVDDQADLSLRQVLDLGRFDVSNEPGDAFSHRVPSLRNIAKTPPYGRSGFSKELGSLLKAHTNAERSARETNGQVSDDKKHFIKNLASVWDIPKIDPLTDSEIADLIAFLESLTDERGLSGRLGKPSEVPSSLALD